ncbi:DUF6350 family protein [Agreia bicolorata]|uniref:cell division protein PerM n=1 Tax=Agreia bicolorata TaxID=110935 RepID=UPI000698A09E|nr:DUF6350 family protein [Agreia bicolorata]
MNRPFTAFLAFLDALLVGALGLGILLIPLTVLWLTQFELAVDYGAFWRVAANFWLLGNGVDLLVTIDPTLALQLALQGAGVPFDIGFAPLGVAVLTVLLGWRSGRRLADSEHRLLGSAVGVLTVAAIGWLVAVGAGSDSARPSVIQALVFPAAIYAIGMATSLFSRSDFSAAADPAGQAVDILARSLREIVDRTPAPLATVLSLAARGGAMAVAGLVAVGGIVVFVLILGHYGQIISLYESLQSQLVGGIALTVGQLSIVPNMVIWATSWLLGPGFTLGSGSIVSPLGTQVGLIPALPILGALPQGAPALGYAVIVVPVIIGFVVGVLLKPRLTTAGAAASPVVLVLSGLGVGVVGASLLALLAIWSGGAAGPGRLVDIGPDPAAVWLWSALELAPSAVLGLTVGLTRRLFSRSSGAYGVDGGTDERLAGLGRAGSESDTNKL